MCDLCLFLLIYYQNGNDKNEVHTNVLIECVSSDCETIFNRDVNEDDSKNNIQDIILYITRKSK